MKTRKKTMGSALLLLFTLALGLILFKEIEPKPHHETNLDAILTLGSKEAHLESSQVLQLRKNGTRELYIQKEGTQERKKTELHYNTSILTLDTRISKKNLNEKMEHVLLISEEKPSSKGISPYTTMESAKAYIVFETGEIVAEDVLFKKTKNHLHPEQGIFFLGNAKKARGSIIGGNIGIMSDVFLKTPFGTIKADMAEVHPKSNNTGSNNRSNETVFVFSQNVVIELNEGQRILCDKASIDPSAMRGVCLGLGNPVRMTATSKKSKSLAITCNKVSFHYEEGSSNKKTSCCIQEIKGEGDVYIEMAEGLTASGDLLQMGGGPMDGAHGHYELTSNAPGLSVLKTPFGLQIKSPKIVFSEKEGIVRFQDPQGECATQGKKLEFSSDFLTWMPLKRMMILEGKTNILLPPVTWKVDGIVNLFLMNPIDPKAGPTVAGASLGRIEAIGDMVFSNIKRGMTLTVDGKALYSAKEHKLTIDRNTHSPQVHIVDQLGQIYSNQAVFLIDPQSKNFEVENINLIGNVSLINKMYSSKEQEALQFILADEALIALKTESAQLLAHKGKRVLIMDKLNRMQVSAPEITIKRSEGTVPFSIKGGGDVRFSFKEEELAEIRKRFTDKIRK